MRPHGTLSVIHGVCTVRRYVFSVPLWLFFLDVTKVPNLCPPPSQRKEGEKRNSSDKKERTKREIQSHPSCYPGASGGGSVHPTYGER